MAVKAENRSWLQSRRLGVRTSFEIEEERRALKPLRGDFDAASKAADAPAAALRAVQGERGGRKLSRTPANVAASPGAGYRLQRDVKRLIHPI